MFKKVSNIVSAEVLSIKKAWPLTCPCYFCAARVALVKCRDLHWAMMAHREQRDISLASLRMLIVADGANPCEYFISFNSPKTAQIRFRMLNFLSSRVGVFLWCFPERVSVPWAQAWGHLSVCNLSRGHDRSNSQACHWHALAFGHNYVRLVKKIHCWCCVDRESQVPPSLLVPSSPWAALVTVSSGSTQRTRTPPWPYRMWDTSCLEVRKRRERRIFNFLKPLLLRLILPSACLLSWTSISTSKSNLQSPPCWNFLGFLSNSVVNDNTSGFPQLWCALLSQTDHLSCVKPTR